MGPFSYKNLIATFFVDKKPVARRSERMEKCFQFIADKTNSISAPSREIVKKRLKSLDLVFMRKWLKSKSSIETFELDNVEWLQTEIKVYISYIKLS